jgi:hypothetical protein
MQNNFLLIQEAVSVAVQDLEFMNRSTKKIVRYNQKISIYIGKSELRPPLPVPVPVSFFRSVPNIVNQCRQRQGFFSKFFLWIFKSFVLPLAVIQGLK